MERREFLQLAAMSAATIAAGCTSRQELESSDTAAIAPTSAVPNLDGQTTSSAVPRSTTSPTTTSTSPPRPPPQLTKVPLPNNPQYALPGQGNLLAWTVDDGRSAECIRRYIDFAVSSGTRFTFFVTGRLPSWIEVAADLQPLVASGQIQLANHGYNHDDLRTLDDEGVTSDLQRNHDFLFDTFGVDSRPFYRPPYGARDERTDRIAETIGYRAPFIWQGLLDEGSPDDSRAGASAVLENAKATFGAQAIVLGHLNGLSTTLVFPELEALIIERGLQTVTLHDVFLV